MTSTFIVCTPCIFRSLKIRIIVFKVVSRPVANESDDMLD